MTNIKKIFSYFVELRLQDFSSGDINEVILSYKNMNIVDLINSLASLNLSTEKLYLKTKNIEKSALPCFIISSKSIKDFCNEGDLLIYNYEEQEGIYYIINDNDEKQEITPLTFDIDYALLVKEFNDIDLDNEIIFKNTCSSYTTWGKELINRFRSKLRLIYVLTFLSVLTDLALPLFAIFGYKILMTSKNITDLIELTSGVIFLILCGFFIRNIRSRVITWCSARVNYLLQTQTLNKISSTSDSQLEKERIDNQINRFEDINYMTSFLSSTNSILFLDVLFSSILIIPIIVLSWEMAVPLLTLAPIYYFLYKQSQQNFRINKLHYRDALKKKITITNELKRRSEAIFLENILPVFSSRLSSVTSRTSTLKQRNLMLTHQLEFYVYLFTLIAGAISILIGINLLWKQELMMGSFLAILIIMWKTLKPAQQILTPRQKFDTINYALKNLHQFFMKDSELRTYKTADELFLNNYDIQFRGVNYMSSSSENLFVNTDLIIEHGKSYGIHGGAQIGKDTLLKLINKTYMPDSGTITIGGVDNRQFDIAYIRQKLITINLENSLIREMSIYENIKYVTPLITKKEVLINIERLGLTQLLKNHGVNIDTPINGSNQFKITDELYAACVLLIPLCSGAKITLIEEVPSSLINQHSTIIKKFLSLGKDNFTIVFCSDHREILQEADKIIHIAEKSQVKNGDKLEMLNELEEKALV